MRSLLLLALPAFAAQAQSIPGAVLTRNEPHHHPGYEDDAIRVLRVAVAPKDSTWLHEHDVDYVWIAVGNSTIINAKLGAPDATMKLHDLAVHYSPDKFAHVARNIGTTEFDNVTVELLRPQTNPRNLCDPALDNKPVDCHPPKTLPGITYRPEVTTDQLQVSLVTLEPGKALMLDASRKPTWIVALDTLDIGRGLLVTGDAKWAGGTLRLAKSGDRVLKNNTARRVRALVIVAK